MAQTDYTPVKDTSQFKQNLKKMSEKTKTIDCEFVQEKSLEMLTNKVISKGHFYFKKPKIRWEYNDPYNYLIIFANNKVFIKDDGGKKQYDTQSDKVFKELGMMMLSFIQGNITSSGDSYYTTYLENQQNYYLKLIPKDAKVKEMLSQVDLYLDKTDLSIAKIKMLEPNGDYTSIEFINKKINQDIDNSLFNNK